MDQGRHRGSAGVRAVRENLGECVRLLMHELVQLVRIRGGDRSLHRTDRTPRGGGHGTRWQGNRHFAPHVWGNWVGESLEIAFALDQH